MVDPSPVLVVHGEGDADWASCLMLDLDARGLRVAGHTGPGGLDGVAPSGLIVIRSWRKGGRVLPPAALVEDVRSRNGRYVVARRDWTHYQHEGRDPDCPGATHQYALWDDYYQPYRQASGRGAGGGIGNVLDVLLRPGASIDLPDGYVFISYHHETDGAFVNERLRPVLSRVSMTSWAYRSSERIPDDLAATRLDKLVRRAGVVLVVSTPDWSTSWSKFELEAARTYGIPVIAVRPHTSRPSDAAALQSVPHFVVDAGPRSAAALASAALQARGTREPS